MVFLVKDSRRLRIESVVNMLLFYSIRNRRHEGIRLTLDHTLVCAPRFAIV